MMLLIFLIVYYGFPWAKLVIKNKNQTFFHNNKNNNRKKSRDRHLFGESLVTSFPDSLSV